MVLAILLYLNSESAISLFLPMVIIYFGLSFVFGNAAALALQNVEDKGNASAMMSFINMTSAFVMVTCTGFLNVSNPIALPIIYAVLIGAGFIWESAL